MDDFIKVFAAGILIFATAIALLGSGPIGDSPTGDDFKKEHIVFEGRIGAIGQVTENLRNIPLGDFEVGYTVGDNTIKQEDSITIQNGWFAANSEEMTFEAKEAQKAVLLFDVADTNNYGQLVLYFNGKMYIVNTTEKTAHRFEFEDMNTENTLTITATSSGPKFWAPTTYILENVKLVVEEYGVQQRIVPFDVYNYEASGWSRGKISFFVDEAIKNNPLFVEINNYKVYEEKPLGSETVYEKSFTVLDTKLKAGENIISFSSGKDSTYSVKNAELTLFFYSSGEAVSKTRSFDIDRYFIYLFEQSSNVTGRINITVVEAPVDTGLTVKLNEKTYHIDTVGANETLSLPFFEDDVHEGKNTLSFSTWGTYKLGDATVEIVDARKK